MVGGHNLLSGKKVGAAPDFICRHTIILTRHSILQQHRGANGHWPNFNSNSTLGTAHGRINQHGAGHLVNLLDSTFRDAILMSITRSKKADVLFLFNLCIHSILRVEHTFISTVRQNENSVVGCIAFIEQLSLNGIIDTECNLIPNLDVPGCIIHKNVTTMKIYLASVHHFEFFNRTGRALRVIHRDPFIRNQIYLLKFHFLVLILNSSMSFGRLATGLPKLTRCTLELITVTNSFRFVYW